METLSDVVAESNAFILRHLPLTATILVAFAVSAAVRYILGGTSNGRANRDAICNVNSIMSANQS
jgi:hypothetical protein